jgi:hypothetical protein
MLNVSAVGVEVRMRVRRNDTIYDATIIRAGLKAVSVGAAGSGVSLGPGGRDAQRSAGEEEGDVEVQSDGEKERGQEDARELSRSISALICALEERENQRERELEEAKVMLLRVSQGVVP